MALRLGAGSIAQDVRRLVRKELDAAVERLRGGATGGSDIHEARKSI
jgi:hypothetical protein